MLDTVHTTGAVTTGDQEKRALAKLSGDFNLKNEIFFELFPELVVEIHEKKK